MNEEQLDQVRIITRDQIKQSEPLDIKPIESLSPTLSTR